MREKELLVASLNHLEEHRNATLNGSVPFQIEIKRLEREAANRRNEERKALVDAIGKRTEEMNSLAYVPVDVGSDKPKLNLTLLEGQDIKETVASFCRANGIPASYVATLENSLRKQIKKSTTLTVIASC